MLQPFCIPLHRWACPFHTAHPLHTHQRIKSSLDMRHGSVAWKATQCTTRAVRKFTATNQTFSVSRTSYPLPGNHRIYLRTCQQNCQLGNGQAPRCLLLGQLFVSTGQGGNAVSRQTGRTVVEFRQSFSLRTTRLGGFFQSG